jgi:hypothetical protein
LVAIDKKKLKHERLGNGLGDDNGLSWTCAYSRLVGKQILKVESSDKKILRDLARIVAKIAEEPQQVEKKQRWGKHNSTIETMPLIFCDPELAWYEIIPLTLLKCSSNLARLWEFRLRKEIYWANRIRDDRVTLPEFTVQRIFAETSRGIETKILGRKQDGSYTWDHCVKDYSMIDELKPEKMIFDFKKTEKLLEKAKEIFDGILDVRLEGSYWWSLGMTGELIKLRGFENIFFDMYDNPDGLHGLMRFLRDEILGKLCYLEKNSLLSLNNLGDFVGTGGYGWTEELPSPGFDSKHVRLIDIWGFSESQETTSVSPEFFGEFIFPYQKSILERFGLNIYGCCEPLEKRWEIVKSIPRLRRVTVSPWSDPGVMAEMLGRDHVYCRKINPAHMSTPVMDEESARRELKDTFLATRKHGCPVEVMLRDVRTFSWNPNNAINWVNMAREEAERIYNC